MAILFLVFAVGPAAFVRAESSPAPVMVVDLNTTAISAVAGPMFPYGHEVYFVTNDGLRWRTDGTPEGTFPYQYGSEAFSDDTVRIQDTVIAYSTHLEGDGDYFYDVVEQCEWDLGSGEESCFADYPDSIKSSSNAFSESVTWGNCTFFNHSLATRADVGFGSSELSHTLKAFCPSTDEVPRSISTEEFRYPVSLRLFHDSLLATYGYYSWKSDLWVKEFGGTYSLRNLTGSFPDINAREPTILNGKVYFVGFIEGLGRGLCTIDLPELPSEGEGEGEGNVGEGTHVSWNGAMVRMAASGTLPNGYWPSGLIAYSGWVYSCGNDDAGGAELWRSDGTPEGTTRVADINPGPGDSQPRSFFTYGNKLYFVADDGARTAGIYVLKSPSDLPEKIVPFTGNSVSGIQVKMAGYGDRVYFGIYPYDVENPVKVSWESDGTAAGTRPFAFATSESETPTFDDLAWLDGALLVDNGTQLLRLANGDPPATVLADFSRTENATPHDFVAGNGFLYFDANETNTRGMWKLAAGSTEPRYLGGTEDHVGLAVPIGEGHFYRKRFSEWIEAEGEGSWGYLSRTDVLGYLSDDGAKSFSIAEHVNSVFEWNGIAAFTSAGQGKFIGISDGTQVGSRLISPPNIDPDNYGINVFFHSDDWLFFIGGPRSERGLWASNGTAAGTQQIAAGAALWATDGATLNGVSYFALSTVDSGNEVWRSDGTAEGTHLVADLEPGTSSSGARGFAHYHGNVICQGVAGGRYYLWQIDPATEVVSEMVDLFSLGISSVSKLRVFGDLLFFVARAADNSLYLYRSDGTPEGTFLVASATDKLAYVSWYRERLVVANDASGWHLLETDGTVANTVQFGPLLFSASAARTGNHLVVARYDEVVGAEYVAIDLDTHEVIAETDLYPGAINGVASSVKPLTVGANVYFSAIDPDHGIELWTFPGTVGLESIHTVPLTEPSDGTLNFMVRFSTVVGEVDVSDFRLAQSGDPGAVITGIETIAPDTYRVSASIATFQGRVKLVLRADNDITNLAGIPLGGAGDGTEDYTFGDAFVWLPDEPSHTGEREVQSADQDGDFVITLSELLRVIQFYNSLGLHCAASPGATEDGYEPGPGGDQGCAPYDTDYNPQDWVISLTELLRVIQFYNSLGYYYCPLDGTEDGFCPGTF